MGKEHMNQELMEKYPNKYKLTVNRISHLKILDWDKLKKNTRENHTMNNGPWYCHCEGCNIGGKYNDEDEFWIGFRESDNKIRCYFTAYGGMTGYKFDAFYYPKDIENRFDMNVQVNAIRWLNKMIDEGVLGF